MSNDSTAMFAEMTAYSWVAFVCLLEWAFIHLGVGVLFCYYSFRGDITGFHSGTMKFTTQNEHW